MRFNHKSTDRRKLKDRIFFLILLPKKSHPSTGNFFRKFFLGGSSFYNIANTRRSGKYERLRIFSKEFPIGRRSLLSNRIRKYIWNFFRSVDSSIGYTEKKNNKNCQIYYSENTNRSDNKHVFNVYPRFYFKKCKFYMFIKNTKHLIPKTRISY